MRKKLSLFLSIIMITSSVSVAYAEESEVSTFNISKDALTSQSSIEHVDNAHNEIVESESAIQTYASTSDNFANVTLTTANGTKYTLVVNTAYKYLKSDTEVYAEGAQITNIAQDSKNTVFDLAIPSSVTVNGKQYPIISIGEAAFDNANITSLTVPDSVYEIQERAFINCSNLKTVKLNGPADSPKYTFEAWEKTNYGAIPTIIGDSVFENCAHLVTVDIIGYDKIKNSLFKNDISLKTANIYTSGYGVNTSTGGATTTLRTVTIGDSLCYGCKSLESFEIKDTVTTVGSQTFVGCLELKTLKIGKDFRSGLTYEDFIIPAKNNINEQLQALKSGSTREENIILVNEDTEYYNTACSKLQKIDVVSENKSFVSDNGILYTSNYQDLVYIPQDVNVSNLVIPTSTKSISEYAAYKNNNLKELVFNNAVNLTAGQFAFYKSNLEKIHFKNKFKANLNQGIFMNCTKLNSITVDYNHTGTMGNYAFMNCDRLTDLNIIGFSSLGMYAFAFCDSLTTLKVGEGISTYGEHVFAYNYQLLTANLQNSGKNVTETGGKFNTYVFAEDYNLKSVILPESLLGISSYTFDNCRSLESVQTFRLLQSIASNAFRNTEKLSSIKGIRYLAAIDKSAFNNCPSLKELEVTRALVNIVDDAFLDCPNLTIKTPKGTDAEKYAKNKGIKITYNQDDIEDWEFLVYSPAERQSNSEYKSDTRIVLPAFVLAESSSIPLREDLVVSGYLGGFHSLNLEDSEHLYSKAFYGNWINNPLDTPNLCSMSKYLESIKFGKIESILTSAFTNALALKNVEFTTSLQYIGPTAFSNCKALTGTLYLPFSLEKIDTGAFQNCISLDRVDTDFRDESVINSNLVANEFKIAKNAFQNCTALKSFNTCFTTYEVSHPSASVKYYLKEIGETAFKNCTSLASVYFNGNLEKIAPKAFENCTSLKTVTLDNSVLVQSNAFAGCTNLINAIIVGEANVAISNNPFCDSNVLTVATTDLSKAQSYIDYKKSSNPSGNYSIQLRTFDTINGKAYLKSKIVVPSNVIVYKDGKRMNTDVETAIYTNVLTFSTTQAVSTEDEDNFVYSINGTPISGRTYTLTEFEPEVLNITVTRKPSIKPGDVDCDDAITASDAAFVLQKALISTFELPSDNKASNPLDISDVDCDGAVTASDAAFVLQKALISTFELPAEKKL